MKVVGAVDTAGSISEEDLLRCGKIAGTFLYVIDQYSREETLSTYDALLAILMAGRMAAMHTKSETMYQGMLELEVKGELFKLVSIDGVAGTA